MTRVPLERRRPPSRKLTARRAEDRLLTEHELIHRDPRLATPYRHVQDRPARLDRLDSSHERALVRRSFERQIDAGIGPGQLANFGDDVGLERREEVVSACELCLFATGRRRFGADDFSERGNRTPRSVIRTTVPNMRNDSRSALGDQDLGDEDSDRTSAEYERTHALLEPSSAHGMNRHRQRLAHGAYVVEVSCQYRLLFGTARGETYRS